jgi:uridine kinase
MELFIYPNGETLDILVEKIIELSKEKNIVISIDGRCAAGKTTLAAELQNMLGSDKCNVIHADDFFLPMALRTAERLKEAGGNIHYERLFDEVINGIKSGEAFSYGVFDCKSMSVIREEAVCPTAITIVEGVYSQHPFFGDVYDLKIFCDINANLQRDRVIARNGVEMHKKFESEWIPMEEKYFKTFNIMEKCDFLIKAEA